MKTLSIVDVLRTFIERYTVTAPGVALVLALWVINSYLWPHFDFCPYLFITSPVKRCGKTTLLALLSYICCHPLFTSAITAAALARSVELRRPTLLIDEAEDLSPEMRTVLNAGFKKGGFVLRCSGTEVKKIRVYSAKAIASIGRLPETVRDRSITVNMRRRRPAEQIEPLRVRRIAKSAARLRDIIEEWVDDHRKEVIRAYKHLHVDFLQDREADIWEPLIAIASVAAPSSMKELKGVVTRLSDEKARNERDDSQPMQLLQHIHRIFRKKFGKEKRAKLSTEDLLTNLERIDARWGGLSSIKLADLLRPFGIAPRQLWIGGENVRGYRRRDFSVTFSAYLPTYNVESGTP